MKKEQVKGKIDEISGRARRQAGEWTGDIEGQAKGSLQEIKGRGEQAIGKMKQAGEDIKRDLERRQRDSEMQVSEKEPRKKSAA